MNETHRRGALGAVAHTRRFSLPRRGRIGWFVRRRLIAPCLRRNRPPEYAARGVFAGLLIGLTPTLGLHLPLLFAGWALVSKLAPKYRFDPVVATVWTWVMNPLTAGPLYYLYLVTGRAILGGGPSADGYAGPGGQLDAALAPGAGWMEAALTFLGSGFERYGLPLLIGCLPWALLGAYAGYRWSLWVVRLRRGRRTTVAGALAHRA